MSNNNNIDKFGKIYYQPIMYSIYTKHNKHIIKCHSNYRKCSIIWDILAPKYYFSQHYIFCLQTK